MRRARTLVWVTVMLWAGAAWAAKPKLAVLGLEVAPGPGGAVEPAMTALASEITTTLRQHVQSEPSQYMLAPDSYRELTDEKLINSCDDEAVPCMAAIGAGMSADFVVYGRLERRGERLWVSLKLLDVRARSVVQTTEDNPVGTAAIEIAKRLATRWILEPERAPVPPSTGGPGAEPPSAEDAGSGRTTWKWALGASVGVGAIGGALAGYSYYRMSTSDITHNPTLDPMGAPHRDVVAPSDADCDKSIDQIAAQNHAQITNPSAFHSACRWRTRHLAGLVVAGVGAAGAAVSLFMLLRSGDEPPASQSAVLAPVVTPELTGASLSLTW